MSSFVTEKVGWLRYKPTPNGRQCVLRYIADANHDNVDFDSVMEVTKYGLHRAIPVISEDGGR